MIHKTAALFLTLAALPLAAQSFEGTITMNIVSDNGAAHPMSFMLRGGKIRFDVGGGQMTVVTEPAAQRMMVIVNAQKMYTESSFAGAVASIQQQAGGNQPNTEEGAKGCRESKDRAGPRSSHRLRLPPRLHRR